MRTGTITVAVWTVLMCVVAVQVVARADPGWRESSRRVRPWSSRRLAEHNRQHRRGHVSFAVRRTRHTRLPHVRFLRAMAGYNRTALRSVEWNELVPPEMELPGCVDWRAAGAVGPVREQNYCASCWAFSAVGALEGQYFLKYGKLVPLSAQNLIDCSAAYGNNGCNGGLMDNAFKYIRDNGGIDTEASYPYEAVDDKCRSGTPLDGTAGVRVAAVRAGDEQALRAAAAAGPVAVAVDASPPTFRAYSSGLYYDRACSEDNVNHAMLLVGYGSDEDGSYWLLKNSWGTSWGLRGYMKLARDRGNHCGVATAAFIPLLRD